MVIVLYMYVSKYKRNITQEPLFALWGGGGWGGTGLLCNPGESQSVQTPANFQSSIPNNSFLRYNLHLINYLGANQHSC